MESVLSSRGLVVSSILSTITIEVVLVLGGEVNFGSPGAIGSSTAMLPEVFITEIVALPD